MQGQRQWGWLHRLELHQKIKHSACPSRWQHTVHSLTPLMYLQSVSGAGNIHKVIPLPCVFWCRQRKEHCWQKSVSAVVVIYGKCSYNSAICRKNDYKGKCNGTIHLSYQSMMFLCLNHTESWKQAPKQQKNRRKGKASLRNPVTSNGNGNES